MSIIAMNWAWDIKGLKPAVKLLLMKLADYADEDHSCFPGNEHLAEKCEVSVRTIVTYIQELSDRGLVTVERRTTPLGYRTSNRYWLSVDPSVSGTETSAPGAVIDLYQPNDSSSADSSPRDESKVQAVRPYLQAVAPIGEPPDVNHLPPTPAPRGSGSQPHPDIAVALRGQPLAGPDTRACKKHARQRASCINCWTFRELTFSDIPWCGECDHADSRLVQVDPDNYRAGMTRCPRCNPRAMTPSNLESLTPHSFAGAGSRGQGVDMGVPRGDREL